MGGVRIVNEHTRRILKQTLTLLGEYRRGTANLRYLVNGLEGSLNALEEELPETFYTQWYIHWGGLEQILAAGTERKRRMEILEEVEALEALLSQCL
jgi:hypothetical protein